MTIKTYDNFFPNDHSQKIFNFVINSVYKIGWRDSEEPQHRSYLNIYSSFSEKEVAEVKILEPILKKIKLSKKHYDKCIVNLIKPLDVNFIHMHPDQLVALYYVNITWNPEWGGETLFYEKDRKTIKLASPYVPNRLMIFDGKVPHTIKSQNLLGPSCRFTISIFFNRNV
jgi:Rps23 Pro-64 3,4-dihydroxylase Tpa1-like proline 4-hydroxylase|tara:strand:- start:393 stop:902 length:510 start_codon:yes stop_codon:yes gene_type:complete